MLCSSEYRTTEEPEYSAIPSVTHHRQIPLELNYNRPDNQQKHYYDADDHVLLAESKG
jgi:hypothetical protein